MRLPKHGSSARCSASPRSAPPCLTLDHSNSCHYQNFATKPHRVPKQRVWLAKGYDYFRSAWRTLQGIEAVHMIWKGRARWVAKGDALAQARFLDKLFGLTA